MSTGDIQFQQVMGSIKLLSEQTGCIGLQALGVTQESFNKLVGNAMWVRSDQMEVRSTIESLLQAGTTMAGFASMVFPAEWVCAFGAFFVRPTNYCYFCRIMEAQEQGSQTIEAMSQPSNNAQYRRVRADQMFSMICRVMSGCPTEIERFQRQWSDATELEIIRQLPGETGGGRQ